MKPSNSITILVIIVFIFYTPFVYCDVSSSSQKLIKIDEHHKDKSAAMLKKVQISSARGGHSSQHQLAKDVNLATEGPNNIRGRPDIMEVSEVTENHNYEEQGCMNPHPEPLKTSLHFAKLLLSHRFYFPMASSFFYNKISMVLTGKLFDRNDPSKACLRAVYSINQRRYVGFETKVLLKCKGDLLDATCDCKIEGQVFHIHSTAVYSDGAKYVLLVACNSGERGGWAVASDMRQLDEDTKQELRKKIEALGFDASDILEISYSKCDYAINPAVQEGPCKEEIATLSRQSRNKVLHVLQQGVYTPFSSLANVYALGVFLSGVPLNGDGDAKGMCARHHWSPDGTVTSRGFNHRKSILECDTTDITNIQCVPNDDHADNDRVFVYNKNIRPIWTDGDKYVLVYNCLSTRSRTWALYSTTETIDTFTKDSVLKKIVDYGFDSKKAGVNNYTQCQNLTIPTNEALD